MKLAHDTWLVFQRYFGIFIHNPAWVAVGVLQPALYLLLFAPLLKSIASVPGFPHGGAYNVFVPGLLVQLALFGAAGVGFSLISELRLGVVERLRVTPVSRLSLLLGRALRDVLTLFVQAVILVLLALPFGLSFKPLGILIGLGLVALIGLLVASISYALALALKDENSFAPIIFTASLPLLLLSGVLLPMSLAPNWLRTISTLNPFSHAVAANRAVFLGHLSNANVLQGVAIMAVLAAVAVWFAARSFGRAIS
ncbi:MAG TPA: ABC transporter permease [Candidatus Dormibacteraeota bacterium]|nr:ABC transporter permease [Candidatus Dormibacteraeota bacterium]